MKLEHVSKTIRHKVLFDDTSFQIHTGLHRLTGKNGSGKSTLIRLLSGLSAFDNEKRLKLEGDILFLDLNPIGLAPFSIKDNFYLLCKTYQVKLTPELEANVEAFFSDSYNDDYLHASVGTKLKLGLSLLLVKEWDYIFIDETLSTIDNASLEIVAKQLVKLSKTSTIIYVFHNLSCPMLEQNSHILHIEGGKICEI
ncbi:ATP-binding cassette domain-containing protein [Streptococcus orisasini]|uniref:ATP-binding cassette domain-containing protein n=1 Tax=Streptococcus orisasini TaxID=1080071 RepID=UPI00070F7DAF|nr:ABC transporter ATP-binding protein [Streptococcus orisasini]